MRAAFWISFAGAAGVYLTMVLWSLPFVSDAAGGLAPFDMRPLGYSGEQARAFLAALSDEGRVFYIDVQHKLDILYPALLGLALVLGFQLLFPRPWATVFSVIALVGVAADYLENYLVTVMLTSGEPVADKLVSLASFWTVSKSLSATISFLVLLLGFGWMVLRRWGR